MQENVPYADARQLAAQVNLTSAMTTKKPSDDTSPAKCTKKFSYTALVPDAGYMGGRNSTYTNTLTSHLYINNKKKGHDLI